MARQFLNTREAAEFLRVSQASIRRWTETGRLPAQRVGGRRERRFTEADLRTFLSGHHGPAGATTTGRGPGLSLGGINITAPCHLATYFDDDEGRVRLAVPFLAAGLRAGDPCFLLASGKRLDAYRQALENEHIDVEAATATSLLVIGAAPGVTAAAAVQRWETAWTRALHAGPAVIRVVGDMVSEREIFGSTEELLAYEEAFDRVTRRYPVASLCQYDVREFDGPSMLRAARAHPDALTNEVGRILI